jgi:hypothetical protein
MPNIEKLMAVRTYLAHTTDRLNDDYSCSNNKPYEYFDYGIVFRSVDCGTIGCVAGYVSVVFPLLHDTHTMGRISHAIKVLELSSIEAEWLFFPWTTDIYLIDEEGVRADATGDSDDNHYDKAEALRRLDWLIAGKPIVEYIPQYIPNAVRYYDAFVQEFIERKANV